MRLGIISRIGIGVLVGSLVVSVALAVAFPQPMQRRVLFYPVVAGGAARAETHYVPRRTDREAQIYQYMRELILGPLTVGSAPIFPPRTDLRSVILGEEGTLYIDFDVSLALTADEHSFAFTEVVELVEKNISHNFRFVRNTVITLGGQLPGVASFELEG